MTEEAYVLEPASGLWAFQMAGAWHVFRLALSKTTLTSTNNLTMFLNRDRVPTKRKLLHMPEPFIAKRDTVTASQWRRLKLTYAHVRTLVGEKKTTQQPQKLALWPLELAVQLARHYASNVGPDNIYERYRSSLAKKP